MNTKSTISHNDKYLLYEEAFDEGLVYLQLNDPVCLHVDMWEASQGHVTITVPIETWKDIMEGWNKSPLAQNLDLHDDTDPFNDCDDQDCGCQSSGTEQLKKTPPKGEENEA